MTFVRHEPFGNDKEPPRNPIKQRGNKVGVSGLIVDSRISLEGRPNWQGSGISAAESGGRCLGCLRCLGG